MDNELQQLLKILYGDRKMDDKALSSYTKQWDTDHNGFRTIIRNAASDKIKQQTPVIVNSKAAQVKPTLVSVLHNTENIKPIEPKRAANDMSAIANFKEAFRAARQGGHKNFFWKKTKANPSGIFSTEIATSQTSSPDEDLLIPVTSTKADMSKTDLPIFKGPRISLGLDNILLPKTPKIGINSYLFDVNSANAELRNQYKQNPHNNMSIRPYLQQGGNIQGQSNTPLIGNSGASIADIITVINSKDTNAIRELFSSIGLEGFEQAIRGILQMAEAGDGSALQALQTLLELMLGSQKAKLGTKLVYINKLKGICPEGTEKVYLAKGGCMCKQKAKEGAELKTKKMNEVQKFKAQKGNKIEPNDTIHHNKQVYDLTGKHKQFKKLTNKDYRNLPTGKQTDVDNKDMMRAKDAEKKSCGGKTKKK